MKLSLTADYIQARDRMRKSTVGKHKLGDLGHMDTGKL